MPRHAKFKRTISQNQEPFRRKFVWILVFSCSNGRQRGSLTVEDHFRSILGIICGRGSFMVLYNCKFNSGKIRPLLKESLKERRFDIIVVVAQSLTNVAGSSFEFDNSSLSFWSVNNSLLATIQFVSFQSFLSVDRHVTALEMRSTR